MVRTLRWRPEWPFALVVGLAWLAIAAGVGADAHGGPLALAVEGEAGSEAVGHIGHTSSPAELPARTEPSPLTALAGWTLMSVAMMVPVTLPALRHVGLNSFAYRRRRSMLVYAATYVGLWVVFGIVALTAHLVLLRAGVDSRLLLASTLGVAAGWQLTRFKRRAVLRCRRTVALPPVGLRADAACGRFALAQGWRCVVSCWALMAVMAVVGHVHLLAMVALTVLVLVEELTLLGRRLLQPSAVALALAGLIVVGL